MKIKLPILVLSAFALASCGGSAATVLNAIEGESSDTSIETSSDISGETSSDTSLETSEEISSSESSSSEPSTSEDASSSDSSTSEDTSSSSEDTSSSEEPIVTRPEISVDEARLVAWDIFARQDTLAVINAYSDYKVELSETAYVDGVATSYSYLDIASDANGYFAYDYGEEGKDYVASVDGVSYLITEVDGATVGYSNEKIVKRATKELSDYISTPIDITLDILDAFKASSLPTSDLAAEEVPALARIAEGEPVTGDSSSSEDTSSSEEPSIPSEDSSTSEDTSSSEEPIAPVEPTITESLLAYSNGAGDLLLAYAYSAIYGEESYDLSASIDIQNDLPVALSFEIEGYYSADYVITYGTTEEERTVPEFTIVEDTSSEDEHHHEHPWCEDGEEHGGPKHDDWDGDHGHHGHHDEEPLPPYEGDEGTSEPTEPSTSEETSTSEPTTSEDTSTSEPTIPSEGEGGYGGHGHHGGHK